MRLNFSHGSHEYHLQTITNLRDYLKKSKTTKQVAVLLDTKGPEIRTGKVKDGEVKLKTGNTFTFHNDPVLGDETNCSTSYESLHTTVVEGDTILVDDGLIQLTVLQVEGTRVVCRIENDGLLGDTKGSFS